MLNGWRAIGCTQARRVDGGWAAWKVRPRRSAWRIVAAHCPYLGHPPYSYGSDAWRISIQRVEIRGLDTEVDHVIARSEADALASVEWLIAAAGL